MSSPSLTGYSPNNPRRYLGPNVALPIIVIRNREPTGADIKQPNTGKYYSFGTFWLVGETSPGVAPTTGARGDLWYLGYIENNIAVWIKQSVDVGENISSFVPFADKISLTNNTNANITSIILTPGEWDVSAIGMFSEMTLGTSQAVSVSTQSALIQQYGNRAISATFTNTTVNDVGLSIPSVRISVSLADVTRTMYLVVIATFTGGICSAYGRISATRMA